MEFPGTSELLFVCTVYSDEPLNVLASVCLAIGNWLQLYFLYIIHVIFICVHFVVSLLVFAKGQTDFNPLVPVGMTYQN